MGWRRNIHINDLLLPAMPLIDSVPPLGFLVCGGPPYFQEKKGIIRKLDFLIIEK
jgi:hypothetical protein